MTEGAVCYKQDGDINNNKKGVKRVFKGVREQERREIINLEYACELSSCLCKRRVLLLSLCLWVSYTQQSTHSHFTLRCVDVQHAVITSSEDRTSISQVGQIPDRKRDRKRRNTERREYEKRDK